MRHDIMMVFILLALFGLFPIGAQESTNPEEPANQETVRINISGSDTMNILTQRLAEVYMEKHPNVKISVSGGGSGRGIRDLIDGLADIAQASRKMDPEEFESARENGYDPEEHVVALDGLAVAVNNQNPVSELTLSQIKAIYTGAVDNWSQFGPDYPNLRIKRFARESNCGTYVFFKENVMEEADFATDTAHLVATAAIVEGVKQEKGAIGFGGVAYFVRSPEAKVLKVAKKKGEKAVSPVTPNQAGVDLEAVQSGAYPISRPLQYYTAEPAEGEIAKFLNWVKSPEGQKIVEEMEYIPLN